MSESQMVSLDDGRVTVSSAFLPVLRDNQLDRFHRVMALPSATVVRAVPGRSTVRVAVGGSPGYLKRYEPRYLTAARFLLRILHWPGADDEAAREWHNLLLLRQHGFLTAAPIALGQRK